MQPTGIQPQLVVERMTFSASEREAWEQECPGGRSTLLRGLKDSFLRRIIAQKARIRPARFFGEAFLASRWRHDDAWYSSYKWLTSPQWCDATGLRDPWRQGFKAALQRHFPGERLPRVQATALALEAKKGLRPVPPDLWLIRGDGHWFVEVKIPPDRLSMPQIAGLAVIARSLRGNRPVHVACAYLSEEGQVLPRRLDDSQREFASFCSLPLGER